MGMFLGHYCDIDCYFHSSLGQGERMWLYVARQHTHSMMSSIATCLGLCIFVLYVMSFLFIYIIFVYIYIIPLFCIMYSCRDVEGYILSTYDELTT